MQLLHGEVETDRSARQPCRTLEGENLQVGAGEAGVDQRGHAHGLDQIDPGLDRRVRVVGDLDMLGTDAEHDRQLLRIAPATDPQGDASGPDRAAGERTAQEVHRRRADEPCDEHIRRTVVDIGRRAHLLDDPVMQRDDPVGHGHGLDLVMGHIDRGGAEIAVKLLDLGPHLLAQPCVEIGERLVEQEGLGLAHDGAAHGDPLALAAGERPGPALEELAQAQDPGRLRDSFVHPLLRRAAQPEAVAQIAGDVHMGVERVGLEHHGDIAILRRQVVDDPAADPDGAGGDRLQPGDHPQ